MPLTFARRLFAGAAVAGAVVAAGAMPAAAAPKAPELAAFLLDVSVPVGVGAAQIDPILFASEETELLEAKIVYKLSGDVTGLSMAGDEENGSNCETTSATEMTCTEWSLWADPGGYTGSFGALLKADDSAEIGGTATLTATVSAEGVSAITESSKVTIAEAVDLQAGTTTEVSAKPGASFDGAVEVTNAGDNTINGAAMLVFGDYPIVTTKQFSNCRYLDGEITSCVFDEVLEPGSAYRTKLPLQLREDTLAPGFVANQQSWLTPTDLADYEGALEALGFSLGEAGTGSELTLEELSANRRATAPQTDATPDDTWHNIEIKVTGKNGVDLVAVGADLKGAVDTEITAEVGVDNKGPATLNFSRSGNSAAYIRMYAPAGVRVTAVPEECIGSNDGEEWAEEWGQPGYRIYHCSSSYFFPVGDELRYEFGFRITDAASAPGKVTVNEPCECEGYTEDLDKSNNTVLLTVNGITDGGTGGGDPDDPGLPVTGPAAIGIAASGLALLGLGIAGFMIARRRRTTFVS